MVQILFTRLDRSAYGPYIGQLLRQMPDDTVGKYHRFTRWEDAYGHLFGRLLLQKGLSDLGLDPGLIHSIHYTLAGKPYINREGLNFNISHSGTVVACALSTSGRIGLDVEQMLDIRLGDFREIFSPDEWLTITTPPTSSFQPPTFHPLEKFYRLWTQKEAVIKANGIGWGIDPKQIRLHGPVAWLQDESWHLHSLDLANGYAACFATDQQERKPLCASEVDFREEIMEAGMPESNL
jgi:4'-phosphopantetheinyl transferase